MKNVPKLVREDGSKIERYAFIDVYNTRKTTTLLHGFEIDWVKLYEHLTKTWGCAKVFFYSGIQIGDINTESEYKELEKLGYQMRTKTTIPYKRRDKNVSVVCAKCGNPTIKTIDMGYENKSNCDVELTLDVLEHAKQDVEVLLFTGDGDFEYLITNLVRKGVKFILLSSTGQNKVTGKRFSTKLRDLVRKKSATLIELNNWKFRIQKQ